MNNLDDRLQSALDRIEISELLYRIAQSIDRRDWSGMTACFHAGASDNHGHYDGTIEGFSDFVSARHVGIAHSQHHITNIVVDFRDRDTAVVESYCLVWQAKPGSPASEPTRSDLMATSRYVDVATRDAEGRWKLAERTVVFEASLNIESQPVVAAPGSSVVVGRRDADDFLIQTKARIGVPDAGTIKRAV